jgi:rRNA-processing protein FCF1
VVAANGSGDDALAALAAQTTGRRVVATADRELRRRCEAAGATTVGPGWLLALI